MLVLDFGAELNVKPLQWEQANNNLILLMMKAPRSRMNNNERLVGSITAVSTITEKICPKP